MWKDPNKFLLIQKLKLSRKGFQLFTKTLSQQEIADSQDKNTPPKHSLFVGIEIQIKHAFQSSWKLNNSDL